MKLLFTNKGQSLLEIILMIGLAGILIPGIATGLISARSGKAQEGRRVEALALVKESQESLRVIRERGWSLVSTNGTFHPQISGSTWELASGSQDINGLTRSIEISSVNRDTNGAIVDSGGTLDPSTKRVEITVSWTSPSPSSVNSIGYITRYLDNITYTQTTEVVFDAGTHSGTTTTNTTGGEVVLGAGGAGSWCAPVLSAEEMDLPKNGVANAITAIEGFAFAGTGDNASGESYVKVGISNTNPPVASNLGVMNGYKTNDVFGEANYGYIATDSNSKEVAVINIASTPYSEAGYFNAPGNGNGDAVYIVGNTGYMTSGNRFYNFDLSSKSGSRSPIDADGVALAGTGKDIIVVGNYAFIAINSTSNQLQIVNLSTPSNLSISASLTLTAQGGQALFVNSTGDRVYLATANSSTQNELFIINSSNKSAPSVISSINTNGMSPKGITVVPVNILIAVGTGGQEYQVYNISTEASPSSCGGVEVNAGVNGIASVMETDGDAYSYIITGDASNELKIIEGGPGGQYASDGTFTSQTYDIGYQVAFNRVFATINNPNQSSSSYQVGIADAVGNSCAGVSFTYVGPDGTSATSYTTTGTIPLSDDGSGFENPGRCFSYQVTLHSNDGTTSPVFEDITVNYSP